MRFYEFAEPNTDVPKLNVVVDQLKQDLDDGKADPNMTVTELVHHLQKYGITLDVTDLYDMIKNPPLSDLIDNIQGEQIVFKGESDEAPEDEDESEKIVKSMADRARK